MKNSKRTPHTLRGAVLIMVMTVMFVLIFLLAGTIAVVYSAHNRAMVKYEESQAYYTARSMLDAYLDAFLKDNDNVTGDAKNGSTKVEYHYIDNATKDLKNASAKQGRALELDIYALKVSVAPKGAGGLPDAGYPYNGSESLFTTGGYANDKFLYDWVKQYILDLMLGDFTVPSGQTLEQFRAAKASADAAAYGAARELAMTAINSEPDDYKHAAGSGITDPLDIVVNAGKHYEKYYNQFTVSESGDTLYYRVPANTFSGYGSATTGGSYGKVADTFADGATDAVIKVQLLERTFNLSKDGADFKMKFDGGNREKDHVKIKVTCEIMLDGVATTTSVIYANEYVQKPSSSKAIVSLSDVHSGTAIRAFGGVASMATESLNWTNNSGTSGNAYFRGDVPFGSTTPSFILNSSNIFYVEGTMTVGNNSPVKQYIQEGATFFVKEYAVAPKGIRAQNDKGINMICEKFTVKGYGDDPTIGTVFAEDFVIKGADPEPWNLHPNSVNSNGKTVVNGNVYCNYLVLRDDYVDIDTTSGKAVFNVNYTENKQYDAGTNSMIPTADAESNPGTAITDNSKLDNFISGGKIYVAKGLKVIDSTGNLLYTVEKTGGPQLTMKDGTARATEINWAGAANIDATFNTEVKCSNYVQGTGSTPQDSDQDFTYDSATKKRTFTMPAALIGKTGSDANKVELDTLESMYSDYFKSTPTTSGQYEGDSFYYYGDFNDSKKNPYFVGGTGSLLHMSGFDSTITNVGGTNVITPSADFEQYVSEHVVMPADRKANVNALGSPTATVVSSYSAQTTTDPDIQAIINASGGKTFAGVITAGDWTIPAKEDMTGVGDSWYNNLGNYLFVIDTRSGPVDLHLGNGDGGTFGGNFAVLGTNKCTVLMPASTSGVEFVLGGGNATFRLYDSRLGYKPGALNLGTAANLSVPPAIDIVVSENVSQITYGQKAEEAVQGYVYAPFTKFNLGGGNNGHEIDITVDNFPVLNQQRISVIGSIFCKGYVGNQTVGVAFIDPNAVTTPPGDKVFAWSDVYYQRGE